VNVLGDGADIVFVSIGTEGMTQERVDAILIPKYTQALTTGLESMKKSHTVAAITENGETEPTQGYLISFTSTKRS